MEVPDTKPSISKNRNGICKWQGIIFMMHSLLFRVLLFHLNCVLLHRVSWLFLNFCHIPFIAALFVLSGCIAETISRLLWQIQNSFQTEVQNSSVTQHSSRQISAKKGQEFGEGGMGGKIEGNDLPGVCFTHLCVPMPSPDHDSVRKWVPLPVGYRLPHIGLVPRYQKCNWQIGMYLFWLLPLLIKM